MPETPVNVSGQAPTGELADQVDESASKPIKKTSSMKQALRKVFTPRKSTGSDDIPTVEAERSDSGDSKKKKKGGIASAFRNLSSKAKTPRGTAAVTEKTTGIETEPEDSAEKISGTANAIAEEMVEAGKDNAKAAIEASDNLEEELSKATEAAKEHVAAATEKAQKAVADTSPVAPPPVAEKKGAGISDEVQAIQMKAAEKAQVATRAVELLTKPVADKKVEEVKEAKTVKDVKQVKPVEDKKDVKEVKQVKEVKKGKGSASKGGKRRRGRAPLISVLGIAAGIGFIAFKLLTKSN